MTEAQADRLNSTFYCMDRVERGDHNEFDYARIFHPFYDPISKIEWDVIQAARKVIRTR